MKYNHILKVMTMAALGVAKSSNWVQIDEAFKTDEVVGIV